MKISRVPAKACEHCLWRSFAKADEFFQKAGKEAERLLQKGLSLLEKVDA